MKADIITTDWKPPEVLSTLHTLMRLEHVQSNIYIQKSRHVSPSLMKAVIFTQAYVTPSVLMLLLDIRF